MKKRLRTEVIQALEKGFVKKPIFMRATKIRSGERVVIARFYLEVPEGFFNEIDRAADNHDN